MKSLAIHVEQQMSLMGKDSLGRAICWGVGVDPMQTESEDWVAGSMLCWGSYENQYHGNPVVMQQGGKLEPKGLRFHAIRKGQWFQANDRVWVRTELCGVNLKSRNAVCIASGTFTFFNDHAAVVALSSV